MTVPTQIVLDVPVPQSETPAITVEPPAIIVEAPKARAYDCRVTARDEDGFILAFKITPAEPQD